ncbi:MAG: hypothetical protein M3Q10_18830 [Chloroflexota bacterium]|nr:hypothetical protein [Chloroflexota bacterium]
MRKWWLVAIAVVLAASIGGYFGFDARAGAAQDCEDWANQTNERVNDARTLLYPIGRLDAFEGSPDQAAGELEAILGEQEAAEPPENAGIIHDDLIEAMSAGVEGLLGAGNVDPAVQISFAKSIIYNADARLVTFVNTC